MPRAVFTGSIRELSVGDPAAHLRAARIRDGAGRQARVCASQSVPRDTLYRVSDNDRVQDTR